MSISKREQNDGLLSLINKPGSRLHFVGVGGVSMLALAEALSSTGFFISGSDLRDCDVIMRKKGIIMPQDPMPYVLSADALIYSLAVGEFDKERTLAKESGIPQYSRAELLGAYMQRYSVRIGISGTHGKSTTTAMLTKIFGQAALSPTVLSGANFPHGSAFLRGEGDYLIYEACEYKRAFLHFSPSCAIITNVELDHTDCYASLAELYDAFVESTEGAECVVIHESLTEIRDVIRVPTATFGEGASADLCYRIIESGDDFERFCLTYRGEDIGEYTIGTVGRHNVANATAAVLCALLHGIEPEVIRAALSDFRGIERRLELLGYLGQSAVYYDYAHHPTEIEATLRTLKQRYGSVYVLFSPHTYTRTRDLWQGFIRALSSADRSFIYEIFAAREHEIEGVSSEHLASKIEGAEALRIGEVPDEIFCAGGGAIVLMGAGDLGFVLSALNEKLTKRKNEI